MVFYNTILIERNNNGISRAELARLVGVDYNCVWNWEKQSYQPTAYNALILCKIFNVKFEDLFHFTEDPTEFPLEYS